MEVTEGTVLALGEPALLMGYALAGVAVRKATLPDEVLRAWEAAQSEGVTLVLLTAAAAEALAGLRDGPGTCLSAVIPS
jgi:vacuolar-type H+-ATPase subunit F/Vma7